MQKSTREKVKKIAYALGLPLWVVVCIVVSELAVGHALIFLLGEDNFSTPLVSIIYSIISYVAALGLAVLVPRLLKFAKSQPTKEHAGITGKLKNFLKDVGIKKWPTWTDIGLAIVGIIATFILAALLQNVFAGIFPWFNADESQEISFSPYLVGIDKIIAFVALVVVAPIAEEIIFRGWLYGKLRETLTNNTLGIIISILLTSVAFGVVHFQWNVGIVVFAMSVISCLLREITGSLHAGILVHMLKNGLAFYVIFVLGIIA